MIDRSDLRTTAISQADRSFIHANRSLPPHWMVLCGRAEAPAWNLRYRHAGLQVGKDITVAYDGTKNAQICTLGIGKLLLHCQSCEVTQIVPDPARYAKRMGLLPVHPFGGQTVNWASLRVLGDADVERIASTTVDALHQQTAMKVLAAKQG